MSQRDYDFMRLKLFTECGDLIKDRSERDLRLRILREPNETKQSDSSQTSPKELSLKLQKKRNATNRKAVSATHAQDSQPIAAKKRGEKRHRAAQA